MKEKERVKILTPERAAYVAGIIDGEGSISLVRSFAKRTKGRYVYPLVRVGNTDSLLIEWLKETVGGGSSHYTTQTNERCKVCRHIVWAANEAIDLLYAIYPYLVIKRDRARIVIELHEANEKAKAESGGYFGNGHPIPEPLVRKRRDAYASLIAANKKGGG